MLNRKNGTFEVKKTDLLGRIGQLHTKSGIIQTPALLPVIHPTNQEIPPKKIKQIGYDAVITNAYTTWKQIGEKASQIGIHKIIDFNGVVMTDSGGYQILEYGEVEVNPVTMAKYEESIQTDIAVILDHPTGLSSRRDYAKKTIQKTLDASLQTLKIKSNPEILWVGPIQGGRHLDLVAQSAIQESKLNFDIFALGSPTEIMRNYDFQLLMKMIFAAKSNIPLDKPLHLFGAGHPLTMPLAVGLGCDLFDSASYILYAREDRYLTNGGTIRLETLKSLPCSCPICVQYTASELKQVAKSERINLIAFHNLYVLKAEIQSIRQAIHDGRLWELIGAKARTHPKLWAAFKYLTSISKGLEDGTPIYKKKAIYLFSKEDLYRPEVIRHRKRIRKDIQLLSTGNLILISEIDPKPYTSLHISKMLSNEAQFNIPNQIFFISPIFGPVPLEISEVYPISQSLFAGKLPSYSYIANDLKWMIRNNKFKQIIVICLNPDLHQLMSSISRNFSCKIVDLCTYSKSDQQDVAVDQVLHIISDNSD